MRYSIALCLTTGVLSGAGANEDAVDVLTTTGVNMTPTEAGETAHISFRTREGELPMFKVLNERSRYADSTRLVYSRDDESVNFDNWLETHFTAEELAAVNKTAEAEDLSALVQLTTAWRTLLEGKQKINVAGDADGAKSTEVWEDVTLVVPLGSRKMLWGWVVLQSLLTSSVLPKSVVLVTGVDPQEHKSTKWRVMRQYIEQEVLPHLPRSVGFDWAIYDGPGGAAISRSIGGALAKTKYTVYHDADDALGISAIEFRVGLLREDPEVDQVLTGYTGDTSSAKRMEHIGAFLKDENEERSFTNDIVALDQLSSAYMKTQMNITEVLAKYNKTRSINYVLESFSNKQVQNLTTIDQWPQLQYFKNCNELIAKMKEAEAESHLSEEEAEREIAALEWFQSRCGTAGLEPEYVGACHNGWGAIKTDVFQSMPLINPSFGEDALLNFMTSHSNHTAICVAHATGGVYTMYRSGPSASVGRVIFGK